MLKLSSHHIELLYAFTRKHFVECYDVQTELVDHLAHGIEAQWLENPNVSFDAALKIEFKKFGVFGFMEIVEIKTNALQKQYRSEVFKSLKDYFKLPKITITILSIYLMFNFLKIIENFNYVILGFIFILFFYVFYALHKEQILAKKQEKLTGKKWLFETVNAQLGGFVHFFNIGIYMPLFSNFDRQWDSVSLLVFSSCLILYVLLFYVSIHIVSPKLKCKFSKENPEYILI